MDVDATGKTAGTAPRDECGRVWPKSWTGSGRKGCWTSTGRPRAKHQGSNRPSGQPVSIIQKARRVKGMATSLREQHASNPRSMLSGPNESIRRELSSLEGIGRETADFIMVFGAGRASPWRRPTPQGSLDVWDCSAPRITIRSNRSWNRRCMAVRRISGTCTR
jgi:hypothetical protein